MLSILVVDDELEARKMVIVGLQMICTGELEFQEASDGQAALDFYRSLGRKPDLIITDCNMPNMDGDQFISEIKKTNPAQVVIAMTGIPQNNKQLEAAGAAVVIAKPFPFDELEAAVKKVLNPQHV